jgi:hypothetical protein
MDEEGFFLLQIASPEIGAATMIRGLWTPESLIYQQKPR